MSVSVGSIISQGVKNLNSQYKQSVNYLDVKYSTPPSGALTIDVQYGQVIVNDLEIWLQSTGGDYYRRPGFGGFFDGLRKYTLSAQGAQQLGADLLNAISAQFPSIAILALSVDPDYANVGWRIKIVAKDTLTGYVGNLYQGISHLQ